MLQQLLVILESKVTQNLATCNPCFIREVLQYHPWKTVQGCREQSRLLRTTLLEYRFRESAEAPNPLLNKIYARNTVNARCISFSSGKELHLVTTS